MARKKASDREIARLIADHQANLVLLAATWGAEVLDAIKSTDNELAGALPGLLENAGEYVLSAQTLARYQELQRQILLLRLKGYELALEYMTAQCEALAANEAKWAATLAKSMNGPSEALHQLEGKSIKAMVDYAFVNDGKTIQETFQLESEDDAQRIADSCRAGVAQGKSTDQIIKEIRGTKEGNYQDGILQISRTKAEAIARTICTGMADEAKMQLYIQNPDVCLGTKQVATLSSNTCLVCAVYDGIVWRLPDQLNEVVKLPVHPNCRCVHVPVTELSELNSSTRPAEAANFWKEAEIAYNKKYPKKNWNDLSRSSRLKYYYQAQKDYEKRTGKPAFEQVPQNMNFQDWLKTKDEQYISQYLGKTRFKLYREGKLPLNKFVNPETNRAFTIKELKERDIASFKIAGL